MLIYIAYLKSSRKKKKNCTYDVNLPEAVT